MPYLYTNGLVSGLLDNLTTAYHIRISEILRKKVPVLKVTSINWSILLACETVVELQAWLVSRCLRWGPGRLSPLRHHRGGVVVAAGGVVVAAGVVGVAVLGGESRKLRPDGAAQPLD